MSAPTSAGGQPTSFKTNVNRAKTKRWVEAKSYSYDGDDWGEYDDYDEYGGYDEPPPPSRPTGFRQRGQSATQPLEENIGKVPYEASVGQDKPLAGNMGGAYGQQQPSEGTSSYSATQQPPNQKRSSPFEPNGEHMASAPNTVQHDMVETPTQMDPSSPYGQNVQRQDYYPGPIDPNRSRTPNSGHTNPPGQPVNRGSMEAQSRHISQAMPASAEPHSRWAADNTRSTSTSGRTHSMTGNSSSADFHERRDFSPSAVPPPLNTRNSPSPRNDLRNRPPRNSSLSQQNQASLPSSTQISPSIAHDTYAERPSSSSSSKALPFVRPADIYRRMEEEKEKERQSQDSSRPSIDILLGRPNEPQSLDQKRDSDIAQRLKVMLDPVTERKSEYGFESINIPSRSREDGPSVDREKPRTTSKTFEIKNPSRSSGSQRSNNSLRMSLPDPTRISGFGEGFGDSFLGADERAANSSHERFLNTENDNLSSRPKGVSDARKNPDLQHQPSKGFTSAVHQAFDTAQDQAPPTPSSTANSSVGRSASGGTSTVSPIMSRGPSAVDRGRTSELPSIEDVTTPTQDEEGGRLKAKHRSAGSFGTLTQASLGERGQDEPIEPPPPGFKMGHRRDSSTPSPDNSPAKIPALASMSHLRHPQEADFAEVTPTPTDSTPSNGSSLRASKKSSTDGSSQPALILSSNINQSASPLTPNAQPSSPPAQSSLSHRTNSGGSGHVKNLADRFEGSSRPESTYSNTTPRASMSAFSSGIKDSAPSRPLNERLESFRPNLPGGWESSSSIAPVSVANPETELGGGGTSQESGLKISIPGQDSQYQKIGSSSLELAGDTIGSLDAEHRTQRPPNRQDAQSSTNISLHPGSAVLDPSDEETNVPTPLSKDTPRRFEPDPMTADYFSPSKQTDSIEKVSKEPFLSKPQASLPPLSTNVKPAQYESDRLRREIVKELSPGLPSDPTTAESETPDQAPSRYSTNETTTSKDRESDVLPSEYDNYWNDDSDDTSSTRDEEKSHTGDAKVNKAHEGALSGDTPIESSQAQLQSSTELPVILQPAPNEPRVLTHRFSWEQPLADLSSQTRPGKPELPSPQTVQKASTSPFLERHIYPENHSLGSLRAGSGPFKPWEIVVPHETAELASQRTLEAEPATTAETTPRDLGGGNEGDKDHSKLPEGLEVSPSLSEKHSPRSSEQPDGIGSLIPKEQSQPGQHSSPNSSIVQDSHQDLQKNQILPLPPPPPPPTNAQPKLPAFREILAMKTAAERIRSFNDTRQYFADMNTGLAHWLAITSSKLPEHSDILKNGGRTGVQGPGHRPSPSRGKLAGLIPGSQHGQLHYQQFLDASPQASSPSGAMENAVGPLSGGSSGRSSSQQVQAKSKEFLHSAGVFGGRANTAAKGLFSKGRSKLRDASGGRKASPLATPPDTPEFPSPGLQLQHGALPTLRNQHPSEPKANPSPPTSHNSNHENQRSVPSNTTESEFDAPSIQSLTQSHLADDERSEVSVTEKTDRLPRSSKIYCKRDSLGKRKSQLNEISFSNDDTGSNPSLESHNAKRLTGKPNQERSPQSTESSNGTPTQAYFDRTKPQDLPLEIKRTDTPPKSWQDKRYNVLLHSTDRPSQAVPQILAVHSGEYNSQRLGESSIERGAGDVSPVKMVQPDNTVVGHSPQSLVSRQTQHTWLGLGRQEHAGSFENHNQNKQPTQDLSGHPKPPYPLISRLQSQQSTRRSPSPPQDSQNMSLLHTHSREADQSMLRLPSQDFSVGRPSMESVPSRIDPDRPPSPISPQLPTQSMSDHNGRRVLPAHHGIDHDFAPESDVEEAQRRSSSFAQSYHEAEDLRRSYGSDVVHHHPAYHEGMSSADNPTVSSGSYLESSPGEHSRIPRQQAPEYAFDSVNPSDLPSTETKSRSRRGSRGSAFFKSLAKSFGDPESQLTTDSSRDHLESSPARSSVNADRKSKKSSMLDRKSQTDVKNDGTKASEDVAYTSAPTLRSSTNAQPPASLALAKPSPWADDDEFPMRSKQRVSTGLSKKIHRASTAAAKGGDGGKKKNRFSSLGTLFGRSSQKTQSSTKNIPKTSIGQPRQVSQSILPSTPGSSDPYRIATAPRSHVSPATSDPSPHEGYYAPRRENSQQHPQNTSGGRHPSPMTAPPAHAVDAPAYFQDASIRQQSSNLPTSNHAKSTRTSLDTLRKTSPPDVSQRPSAPRSHNSKDGGSSWARFSASPRSKARRSQDESEPPQHNSFNSSTTAFVPQVQPQTGLQSESPPPPPPPPKDDWHSVRPRQSSLRPQASQLSSCDPPSHKGSPAPLTQQPHQSLPQIQTSVPSPHLGPLLSGFSSGTDLRSGMSPEEKRRSRQLEIETGHMSSAGVGSSGGKPSAGGLGGVREERGSEEEDEKIEMSATSFPGQEWQPSFDYSWAGD